MSTKRISETTQAVQRSIDILEAIASIDEPIGVSELARRIALSKATTFRLCQTLVARQFLEQSAQTGQYRLGIRLLRMSSRLLGSLSLAQLARPILEQMAAICRQNTFVGLVQDLRQVIICEEVRFDNPVQPRPLLGGHFNLVDAPGGLACLASLDDARLEVALAKALHDAGQFDPQTLQQLAGKVRSLRGSPGSVQEGVPSRNTLSVSSPVLSRCQEAIGIIGYCCPHLRDEDFDREQMLRTCSEAARSLSAILPG